MNSSEINTFIELMKDIGDQWEKEDVERVYGNYSLNEALEDRRNDLNWFTDIINKVINHENKQRR